MNHPSPIDTEPPRFETGAATHQAQRESNEDQAAAGHFPGGAYIIVADGVGGEAWGDVASATAVRFAENALRAHTHAHLKLNKTIDLQRVLTATFRSAVKGLICKAVQTRHRFGLKTTLIVGVVWQGQLAVGFVGDGGLWLWQESKGHQRLLALVEPMANEAGELHGVLSPWRRVEPVVKVIPWETGGVLMAATDGIADVIPPEGLALVASHLRGSPDGVQDLLQQLLDTCHGQVDAMGPIFSDNMGIAALREKGE
jgi:serine/threonine protein phosphatase PrpC